MRRISLLPFPAVLWAALVTSGPAGAVGQGDLLFGLGSFVVAFDSTGNTTGFYNPGTVGTNATDIVNSIYTGDVYVVNSGTSLNPSSVSKFLHNGQLVDADFGGPFPGRLQWARSYSPNLYLSMRITGPPVVHTILILDESSGALLSTEFPPGGPIQGFDVVGSVLVYVAGGRLRRYDMSTNSALTDLATPPDTPLAVRRTWEGILVLTPDAVIYYDFDGVLIRTYPASDFGAPGALFGLGFDYFHEAFWTTAPDTVWTTAYRVDLNSGVLLQAIGELPPPTGIGTLSAVAPQSVPVFDHSSECGTTRSVMAGDTLQFVVTVLNSVFVPTVTLTSGPLPPGATMTPPLPVSGRTASSTFTWVPDMSMVGSYPIVFMGTGAPACSMTIEVEPGPVGVPVARSTLPFMIHPRRLDDRRLDIEFTLPADEWIVIRALDVHGRQVGSLVKNAMPAGRHRIRWAVDSALGSGVYWIELQGRSSRAVGRFVLLR